MKIIILSRPKIDIDSFIQLLQEEKLSWNRTDGAKDIEELIEIAGRICYLSFGTNQSGLSNNAFIKNLIENQHTSVLEHISWTFVLTGISRSLSHQLVRHRAGFSFSQLSQQYYDESNCQFIPPPQLKELPDSYKIWQDAVEYCANAYSKLQSSMQSEKKTYLSKTAINNISRSVLPNSTETKLVMSANARAIRNFLELRGKALCDYEMRLFSVELLNLLTKESSVLFYDYSCSTQEDGTPYIVKQQ